MKKLFTALYTASLLLGSFCPMSMTVAMQPSQPMEHVSMSQDGLMSPYIPMTMSAPMSVEGVVVHESMPMSQTPSGCPAGNCITMSHDQNQTASIAPAYTILTVGSALPATYPPISTSLASSFHPPTYNLNFHLAKTISTIVLRV